MTLLNLPDIPASPMYIGEKGKIMTIEWQEFFRSLFDRIGGYSSPSIIESDNSHIAEQYNTKVNELQKQVNDLKKQLYSLTIKSYDNKIAELEQLIKILSKEPFKYYLPQTVWDDYVTPLNKATFGGAANDPTLTKLFDDVAGTSGGVWGLVFADGNEVIITAQMPHKWKEGTTIEPHIHFMCLTDVDPSDNFGLEFEYTWTNIDEDFPADSILSTIDIPTGVNTQYMHQISDVASSGLDGTGKKISSILLCRIKRVAATGDNYAGGVAILDFDIHYEINTIGSRFEFYK